MESFIIDNVGSLVTGGPKEVLWNLLKKGIDYKTWIGIFVEAGDTVATYENRGADYQRHNNRKTNTGALNKKIKWKLSNFIHGNFGILDGTKEHVLNTVKKWENERKSYPKWLIIPYDVCRNLYYKTPRHIGKILDILNDEECMYVVYEFVWRYETGMFSYIIYTQEQVYSVWKKYYLLLDNNDKKCDVKKYINEWFYVGRALLREFKEDGNEEDWNYVWNILQHYIFIHLYYRE